MTKKDYEKFASELNRRIRIANEEEDYNRVQALGRAVEVCASVFEEDNPAFKREMFEEACFTGKHIRASSRG